MSEEEVIKKLKTIKVCGDKDYIYNFEAGTILNLIQKKQEEIETCKEELNNYIEFMETAGDNAGWARGLKWYIDQLETDKQKLIEKVEEYTDNTKREKLPFFKTVSEMIRYKGYAEGKIETCQEILKILKGEKE